MRAACGGAWRLQLDVWIEERRARIDGLPSSQEHSAKAVAPIASSSCLVASVCLVSLCSAAFLFGFLSSLYALGVSLLPALGALRQHGGRHEGASG